MTDVTTPAGRGMIALRIAAPTIEMPAGRGMITINFPTAAMTSPQGAAHVAVNQTSDIEVTQGRAMAAVKGRTKNVKVRAWTFSLDGHDFYVLRLGDSETLVLDCTTGQWVDWDSLDLPFWRANTGINWLGANRYAPSYGSNVLVGDDTWGLLWLLDPELGYDEHPDYQTDTKLPFVRVVMGQYIKRGYDAEPVYSIDLMGALGQPAITGQSVLLEYSDNMGKTFKATKSIVMTEGDYNPTLVWTSLGQVQTPGRLFRITDDGALPRIDDMEMNADG
jgi:hypothetical protein